MGLFSSFDRYCQGLFLRNQRQGVHKLQAEFKLSHSGRAHAVLKGGLPLRWKTSYFVNL